MPTKDLASALQKRRKTLKIKKKRAKTHCENDNHYQNHQHNPAQSVYKIKSGLQIPKNHNNLTHSLFSDDLKLNAYANVSYLFNVIFSGKELLQYNVRSGEFFFTFTVRK
jgi:hypothetical protein